MAKRYVKLLPPGQAQERANAARAKVKQAFASNPPTWFQHLEIWSAERAVGYQADFWLSTAQGKFSLVVKPTRSSRKFFIEKNSPLPSGLVVISVEPRMVDDDIFRVLENLLGIN